MASVLDFDYFQFCWGICGGIGFRFLVGLSCFPLELVSEFLKFLGTKSQFSFAYCSISFLFFVFVFLWFQI